MSKVSQLDMDFGSALSTADYEKAARLLTEGANINRVIETEIPDDRGIYPDTTTYLIEAAIHGDVNLARFLLTNGADPNIKGFFANQTALIAATQQGHAEIVELLLRYGADWSAVDHPSKFSAMEYAISDENAAIVRSLLTSGAPPVFRRLSFDMHGGAEAREIVRLLMQYGFDINRNDDWGRTPLMWAAERAPLETIQLLIDFGADVNIVSGKNMNGVSSNETALKLAMKKKRKEVVALLQQYGAL